MDSAIIILIVLVIQNDYEDNAWALLSASGRVPYDLRKSSIFACT